MPKQTKPSKTAQSLGGSAVAVKTKMPELVRVGTVGGQDILVPKMDRRAAAVTEAIAQFKDVLITTEDEKVWVTTHLLVPLVAQRNEARRELAKITDPLVESRRQALAAKNAAENLFAPFFAGTEAGEHLLKDKIKHFELTTERKRLQEEADARRKAEEEKARIERQAQLEADVAAQKHLEEQRKAEEQSRQGNEEEARRLREAAERELEASAQRVEALQEDADHTMTQAVVPSSSIKTKGVALTGKWVADVVDIKELFAGILDGTTPLLETVRIKVGGKLKPVGIAGLVHPEDIEGVEINLTWFNERVRAEEKNFNYRGMRARFEQDLRVSA